MHKRKYKWLRQKSSEYQNIINNICLIQINSLFLRYYTLIKWWRKDEKKVQGIRHSK